MVSYTRTRGKIFNRVFETQCFHSRYVDSGYVLGVQLSTMSSNSKPVAIHVNQCHSIQCRIPFTYLAKDHRAMCHPLFTGAHIAALPHCTYRKLFGSSQRNTIGLLTPDTVNILAKYMVRPVARKTPIYCISTIDACNHFQLHCKLNMSIYRHSFNNLPDRRERSIRFGLLNLV